MNNREKYNVTIVLRNGKVYLHLGVSFQIYKEYFGKKDNNGKHFASFNLNSGRINMVILNQDGKIIDVKNEHFHEIVSHGFPKNKAKNIRLKSLVKLLDYAYYHNVGIVLFEDLEGIKRRKFIKSRRGNRKISKLAKKELLRP